MQRRQQIPHEFRSHSNFSEVWQVGGDAYTAVAVAKKTGTGSWVVYNIFRDHLGTITHLKNGSTIDEYSYDACSVKLRFCKPCETKPLAEHIPKSVAVREGRRRDKDNWSYTLSGEPALFADRGFTGTRSVSSGFGELCEAKTDERTNPAECSESGKFLSDFNLYNMPARLSHSGGNGRLYDPVVGRFLSPDPYIADPSFTQSYNRYSYVLNNPLKYNDPTGELPAWALWGITSAGNWLFGGMDNWLNKGMSFKQSFSTANNPIVFSGNYHPGSNSWSNTQVNAHRLVGAMANAEQGAHSYIAGFSGMGRNGEGPLFTSTPFDQFVGESPLAGGIAQTPKDRKRVTLATGMTDDFTIALGPVGVSFEIGGFNYEGFDYTIVSLGYAVGWDISAGVNALIIKGYPDEFNPDQLGGWSTQKNFSYFFLSIANEVPFERTYNPYTLDTYRTIIPGVVPTSRIGASWVNGFTWVFPTPKGPTLTELYKKRPGGY